MFDNLQPLSVWVAAAAGAAGGGGVGGGGGGWWRWFRWWEGQWSGSASGRGSGSGSDSGGGSGCCRCQCCRRRLPGPRPLSVFVRIRILVLASLCKEDVVSRFFCVVCLIIVAGPCVPMAVDEANLLAGFQVRPRIHNTDCFRFETFMIEGAACNNLTPLREESSEWSPAKVPLLRSTAAFARTSCWVSLSAGLELGFNSSWHQVLVNACTTFTLKPSTGSMSSVHSRSHWQCGDRVCYADGASIACS